MATKLNPDAGHVAAMRKAIEANNGYCPCVIPTSPDTKCMCKEFREQAKGYCRCELYYKE